MSWFGVVMVRKVKQSAVNHSHVATSVTPESQQICGDLWACRSYGHLNQTASGQICRVMSRLCCHGPPDWESHHLWLFPVLGLKHAEVWNPNQPSRYSTHTWLSKTVYVCTWVRVTFTWLSLSCTFACSRHVRTMFIISGSRRRQYCSTLRCVCAKHQGRDCQHICHSCRSGSVNFCGKPYLAYTKIKFLIICSDIWSLSKLHTASTGCHARSAVVQCDTASAVAHRRQKTHQMNVSFKTTLALPQHKHDLYSGI